MKDAPVKACIGIGAVVACYAIYAFSNPGTDGAVFAGVIGTVGALAGYSVATARKE